MFCKLDNGKRIKIFEEKKKKNKEKEKSSIKNINDFEKKICFMKKKNKNPVYALRSTKPPTFSSPETHVKDLRWRIKDVVTHEEKKKKNRK